MPSEPLESVGPLLDAVGDPLIVVDDGRVSAANRAAKLLLGWEIAGEAIEFLLPQAGPLPPESDEPSSVDLVGLGGPRRHWEMRVSSLGRARRLVHLIDRTAIEAAEKMRVDFVANASHELRTPIAAISGFAETLADDEAGGDPDTRHRFLAIIAREAKRMQRLVEDLMSLSRIEADRHNAPTALVELGPVVREAAQAAAEQRQPRGADLVIGDIAPEICVTGDAAQLAQIAHNLVSNGFKYGRAGTPVTVSLALEGASARLSVRDVGDGIAPEHLSRVTQRFYRVDTKRSRQVGGTGLGLAIVKHVVERHGGRLEISSEVGTGTTVSVLLPVTASSDCNASVTLAGVMARSATKARVLVVEDDASIAELLEWHLSRAGYSVVQTGDGEEAMLLARETTPDLVLLDWMIEGISGLEVCRRLRRMPETANVPILMLTARGQEEDKVRGLETGADDYILKPFSPRELLARIEAVLRRIRPALAAEGLSSGAFAIDLAAHRATRDGRALALGPTEFRLLRHFLENPGRVFSRGQLLDAVWGNDSDIEQRTVDVHIRRLRQAIIADGEDDPVRTVRSAGYSFEG